MDIWVKDRSTGRVIKVTERDYRALGASYRRVNAPIRDNPKKPKVEEPKVEPKAELKVEEPKVIEPKVEVVEEELTREQYLEFIKGSGFKKPGLHNAKLETLKKIYDEITSKENG